MSPALPRRRGYYQLYDERGRRLGGIVIAASASDAVAIARENGRTAEFAVKSQVRPAKV